MSTIPKPRPIAFMVAGYDLADALDILSRWDALTDAQVCSLGLPGGIPVNSSHDHFESGGNVVLLRDGLGGVRNPR